MSGFAGGLLHPLAVPAHALALLALGLLIGQQGAGRMLVPLAGFAVGLAAGLAAIASGGAADIRRRRCFWRRPPWRRLWSRSRDRCRRFACAALAAVAGIALGLDSPPQAISIALATLMLIGTGLGACLALAIVAAGTARFTRAWQRIGVRILGSWIAASAILVLALRFARGQLF